MTNKTPEQIVLESIELTLRYKKTELDLRFLNLVTLPVETFQIPYLEQLNIGSNQIKNIPPEIVKLNKLKCLIASDNQLTSMPPEISQLQELKRLIIV